jgi:3-hydroxyacyl-CoA dehydrogenase/enoyl-CoA hydratase/3-hydroxybutyryl-CoA epimerase
MSSAFHLSVIDNSIGILVFDLPNEKVNKISIPVLEELESIIDRLAKQSNIKALALTSGKEDVFIAGADLKSFEPLFKDPTAAEKLIGMGHRVFYKLSQLPFPTIAAIDGACLGGGLELALACTYRVVSDRPKTTLGLPEVSLGIIPGWGGTQRLPRLVGLIEGLKMIVSGKSITGIQAWKIKLADAIFPAEFFDMRLQEFLNYCVSPQGQGQIINRRKPQGVTKWLVEKNLVGRSLIYWQTKREIIKKTKGHYLAPLAALRLIKGTFTMSLSEGLAKEAETFVNLMGKDFQQAPNLIQIFFNQEALKKNPGAIIDSHAAHSVSKVGILGAGVMGSGIAWLFSNADLPVRMKDIHWEMVGKGYSAAWKNYQTLIKIRKLKVSEANTKFHRLSGTIDYTGFQHLDLIVEAAVENLDLKRKIFKELEAVVNPETIIATNTSSLTVESLAIGMQHPERLVGMHFFNPPSRMPLVEVVASKKTSPEALATAVEICKILKKTPIVVGDCAGFLVNRIYATGVIEVLAMLEEGVKFQKLEKVLIDFGMPMAPFLLADEVGNDVNYKVLKIFEKSYGFRMKAPSLLAAINERKLYGKKVGKGFYLYDKKYPRFNSEILELLPEKKPNQAFNDSEIVERVLLAMINEASRCLEEKVVVSPMHLDMAMILGTGFPPFRGGPLRYADTIGSKKIVERLSYLSHRYGDRFNSSTYLQDLAKSNKKFYI